MIFIEKILIMDWLHAGQMYSFLIEVFWNLQLWCWIHWYLFAAQTVENSERWEYQMTWPASWETYMQVRKQQLEQDMEQKTGSK